MKRKIALIVVLSMASVGLAAGPVYGADGFGDVADANEFHDDIAWLAGEGITLGCNPPANSLFCPDDPVTRGQMAAFFVRALGLTSTAGSTAFTDTAGSVFENDILRVSADGITLGCNPPDNTLFCPDDPVTRGQMAAFYTRALGLTSTAGGTAFTDATGSVFANDILRLSASGITRGCNPPDNTLFCPEDPVTRGQMAAFFHRADATSVSLQILAVNDFHGNIATTGSWLGEDVGRADYLASYLRAAEDTAANSVTVSAGDLIGASPLVSALFHDEPTIEAMNALGLDLAGVGNHEFDEGAAELLRLQEGGTHPTDGDFGGDVFGGADFQFLAANVTVDATDETVFPAYQVMTFDGVDVAFIGMTLEGTPTIVTAAGVAGLTFHDEVETVNALVPELQDMGIEAIVILLHEGGFSDGGEEGDGCEGGLTGPLADIVPAFDDAVDLVIAGHVNDEFVCEVDGKWVTMADNAGRLFTDIDVSVGRLNRDLTVEMIDNVPTYHAGVTAAADLTALVNTYDALSAPLANQLIGDVTADITDAENAAGESALGDIIADAQLDATSGVAGAVVAFMNPGGIRNDLLLAPTGAELAGEVTYGEAFSVQPFGNSLVTMTLTGDQIYTLLEQQWVGQTSPRILQVSDGFAYTWDSTQPDGSKIVPGTVMINAVMVVGATEYRVTVNSFLADGGDNFVVLSDGTARVGGPQDLDALVDYFGVNSPVAPGPQDRITVIP